MKPAGWVATIFLFGVPALVFGFLFHWLGPDLWQQGTSWWRIFHLLLVLPLALMLVAALAGATLDMGFCLLEGPPATVATHSSKCRGLALGSSSLRIYVRR